MPRDRELYFPESTEEGWMEYLSDFKEQVLPIFLKQGFSQDTALQVWFMNKVNNSLNEILTDGIPIIEGDNGSA